MEKTKNILEERDLLLPRHRKSLQAIIEEHLMKDEKVLAAFYGGSIGANSEDLFSDIDLRIVVDEKDLAEFIAAKRNLAERYGRILFFEEMDSRSPYTVAHYDNFIKVDTFYYPIKNLTPSVWLKEIKIVKDSNGLMKAIQSNSQLLDYVPAKDEVAIWSSKFLANLHETYRRAMRGEVYYALKSLDSLRLSMATGWYMAQGIQPNGYGDWAHYEGKKSRLTAEQQALLASWYAGREASEIVAVSREMLLEFKKVHLALCEKTGEDEKMDRLDETINLVL